MKLKTQAILNLPRIKKNEIFIGIDQTGAINNKGQPHPLPTVALIENKILLSFVNTFSKENLESSFNLRLDQSKTYICIDCVLGLPRQLEITFENALNLTHRFPEYGRKSADLFFKSISSEIPFPKREIEIILNANSVFQIHPYQKNIQTGTFRFWKEIHQKRNQFFFPFLEDAKDSLPVFEGYPSFSWKRFVGEKNRNKESLFNWMKSSNIRHLIESQHIDLINKNSNFADSFILAVECLYSAKKTLHKIQTENVTNLVTQNGQVMDSNPLSKGEGWILGYG